VSVESGEVLGSAVAGSTSNFSWVPIGSWRYGHEWQTSEGGRFVAPFPALLRCPGRACVTRPDDLDVLKAKFRQRPRSPSAVQTLRAGPFPFCAARDRPSIGV
jgi:hypothetical protein